MCNTISETKIAKSRKAKRCDWCNEMIEVGQPAVASFVVDGRDKWQNHFHPECDAALGRFSREEGGGCVYWTPGDFNRGCTCENGRCECEKEQHQ